MFCCYIQSLQRELQALQTEIATMNRVATSVMAEAGSESRQLIKTTISSLNERLKTLEREAQDREEQLQEKNNEWKAYQVT